jgi:hypothetical protein
LLVNADFAGYLTAGPGTVRVVSTPTPPVSPGDPAAHRIRSATDQLVTVGELPLGEAAAAFDALHDELQTALTDIDNTDNN